jgi:hypothetical protein
MASRKLSDLFRALFALAECRHVFGWSRFVAAVGFAPRGIKPSAVRTV